MSNTVTRFAPSPTGYLHLGHAYSALFAARAAADAGGRFLLRIEDIDAARCRPEFTAAIFEDLAWLGLAWEEPVRRQSEHMQEYAKALARLDAMNATYPCFCTRAEIAAEIAHAAEAPHGPDGPHYPGTCRRLTPVERAARIARGDSYAIRLDAAVAFSHLADMRRPLAWFDRARGEQSIARETIGDVVLARKDTPTSYHLAVTVDDALQGVTLVTRGEDLFGATHLHCLLQAVLGLPAPHYHHHGLLTDADGRRYAKRDKALTLRALGAAGKTPAEVRALAGIS